MSVVVAAKLGAQALGWEAISLNPLFPGIVAADVFLMGFLLTGVLADIRLLAQYGYGEDNFGNNIALPERLSYLRR